MNNVKESTKLMSTMTPFLCMLFAFAVSTYAFAFIGLEVYKDYRSVDPSSAVKWKKQLAAKVKHLWKSQLSELFWTRRKRLDAHPEESAQHTSGPPAFCGAVYVDTPEGPRLKTGRQQNSDAINRSNTVESTLWRSSVASEALGEPASRVNPKRHRAKSQSRSLSVKSQASTKVS